MSTTHRQVVGFIKRDHYTLVKLSPPADAILACLTILLDHPDSLHTILLVAETRECGAGVVALELARRMAVAGIGA